MHTKHCMGDTPYIKLNLATPPAHLLIWNDNFSDSIIIDDNTKPRQFVYKDGTVRVLHNGVYGRAPASKDLQIWVQGNIVADFKNIGISRNKVPCLGPHMDRTRFYTLQYMLHTGGPEVDTVFYEAESENLDFDKTNLYLDDYRHLHEIDRFRAATGEWHIINGRIPHSVENIQSMRVSLQIGLMRDPIKHGLLLA